MCFKITLGFHFVVSLCSAPSHIFLTVQSDVIAIISIINA